MNSRVEAQLREFLAELKLRRHSLSREVEELSLRIADIEDALEYGDD